MSYPKDQTQAQQSMSQSSVHQSVPIVLEFATESEFSQFQQQVLPSIQKQQGFKRAMRSKTNPSQQSGKIIALTEWDSQDSARTALQGALGQITGKSGVTPQTYELTELTSSSATR